MSTKQSHEDNPNAGPPDLHELTKTSEQPAEEVAQPAVPRSKLNLADRVHNLEIQFEDLRILLEKRIGLDRPLTPAEASAAAERSAEEEERVQMVAAERDLRKYIRRGVDDDDKDTGGFRKGLSPEDMRRARLLMKGLGRKKPVWDLELIPV